MTRIAVFESREETEKHIEKIKEMNICDEFFSLNIEELELQRQTSSGDVETEAFFCIRIFEKNGAFYQLGDSSC